MDSQIKIWDLSTNSLKKTIDPGPAESWAVCFSPDGRQVVTGSHRGVIQMYNTETGTRDRVLETQGKFIMSVAYVRLTTPFSF